CPGGAALPVSAKLTIGLYPYPCAQVLPTATASASISTAGGTMGLPQSSPTGSFTNYTVPVTIPSGTPAGIYCVIGTATVAFSDGITLTQTGDTVVCLVEPSPTNAARPRLDMQLLASPATRKAPGDQALVSYLLVNRDPSNAVSLNAFATSRQVAVRPQGGNEMQGVFAI